MRERGGDLQDPRALLEAMAHALGVELAPARAQMGVGRPVVPVSTVAEWLEKSPRAVRKMIARGEIPASKVGKGYVVLVDDWLARLRSQADDYSPGGGAS